MDCCVRGAWVLILCAACISHSHGADWPRWRGTAADGNSTETGLLAEWPQDGPQRLWQVEGLGNGYGSLSVVNNRIYVMGRRNKTDYLSCRNVDDGSSIWETAIGPGSQENGPNGTPTVDGDRVYGISIAGDLLCADAQTGREIWRVNFERDFGGKMMSVWGFSESPLIDGDKLICTPGGEQAVMVALNKATGKLIWRATLTGNPQRGQSGAGYSSAVISTAGGVRQYVQLLGRGVIGVEANTGKMLWGYDRIANTTANCPTPVVSGDYVLVSTGYGDGGTALLEIKGSRGRVTPREVWYKPANELQNHHGQMILLGDQVYLGHGHNNGFPTCIDLKTGRSRWGKQRGAGRESAAVAYADGHFYFRYQDGTLALVDANPSAYKLKSSFQEDFGDGPRWAHPVIANGKLYLRTNGILCCYDVRAGR
ncbi:MAG: PQQ-like beta-propeller repeat protein [Planctomycetaceae bacterium]|nr:PQQ-like beta-propeller repeat protein [Planctomycetaceae bacterium]